MSGATCLAVSGSIGESAPPALTDLLTDTTTRTQVSAARPAFAGSGIVDPMSGVRLYRVTNPGQPMVGNPSRTFGDRPRIVYPRFQAWNKDQSLLYLTQNEGGGGSGGGTWLQGNVPPFTDVYSRSHPAGWVEGRWHDTDSRQMIYCTGTQLRRLYIGAGTPADNTTALIKDFSGLYSNITLGLNEGEQSRDSDVWPITATDDNDGDAVVTFAYKISTDTVSAKVKPGAFKAYGDGCNTITYDGQYMVIFFDDETFRTYRLSDDALVYTSTVEQQPSHYGMGRANNGDRVVVGGDRSRGGEVVLINVVTGAMTEICGDSFVYHYSCGNHDVTNSDTFGLGDYWGDSGLPYVLELVYHAFDGTVRARLGHIHRGAYIAYSHEVHATVSRDGRYVAFKVDWEGDNTDTGEVCVYIFDMTGMRIPGKTGWA